MPLAERRRTGFVEHTLHGLGQAIEHAVEAERLASHPGLLQRLDPRVKVVGALAWLIAAMAAHRISTVAALLILAVALAVASRLPWQALAARMWAGALFFSGGIALPALALTPGAPLLDLRVGGLAITRPGLAAAAMLVARAETAVTLSLLLVLSTRWSHVLKALRALHVPAVAVVVLGMTVRYALLLLDSARDMFVARRSRTVGPLDGGERRRLLAAGAGVLLEKSVRMSGEVHRAMLARGFRGEIHTLDDFHIEARDRAALLVASLVAAGAWWAG